MNSRTAPAIAVVMPVYNGAKTVERAIRSVLAQDFDDFELIVVDDGSTDETPAVVAAIDDPRLKFIRLPANAGGNAARNRGIEVANAPILAFLDSDDAYLPHKLSFVVRKFAERPDLDVLLDSFAKYFPEGDSREPASRENPVIDSSPEFLKALFNRRLWKATPAISIRREAAIKAGKFDETLKRRQDFDFLIRAAAVGKCTSTGEVTWLKSWMPGAISDDARTYAKATVELCRRHPVYFSDSSYRPGLARDVTRHFLRLFKSRRFADALQDARTFNKQFGTGGLIRLLAEGSREIAARKRLKRPKA